MPKVIFKDIELFLDSSISLLDGLELNGIYDVPYSCRAGNCNFCLLKLISGKLNDDAFFNLDKNLLNAGMFKSCVAYPQSDVKVEL